MHKFVSNYLKGVTVTSVTLPSGTVVTDESTGKLYVHDGVTAGGTRIGGSASQFTLQWTGGSVVTNGTYYYSISAPYSGLIVSATYLTSASTSFVANVQIGGTSVTGLSAVTVSNTTAATTTATAANSFTAGQAITLVITSATGSPTNAVVALTVKIT
jgi:hypothetical protein